MTTGSGEEKKEQSFDQFVAGADDLPLDADQIVAAVEGGAVVAQDGDGKSAGDGDFEDVNAEAKAKADADAKAKANAEAKAEADADAKAKADAEAQQGKPDGVVLKDGKTVIPYQVLESERRRADEEARSRRAAEDARRQAEEQATSLRAEVEALKAGKGKDGGDATQADEDGLRERIAALRDSVPEVGEVMDALMQRLDKSAEELSTFRQREEEREQREVNEARANVQNTIDRTPKLLFLQSEKPELFEEAVKLDAQLRASKNPTVQSLSMEKRFEKVVEMLETLNGEIELPEKYRTAKPAAQQQQQQQGAAPAGKTDVKADPNAKVEDEPTTLTHLPGGVSPTTQKRADDMTNLEADSFVQAQLDKGKSPMDILAALEMSSE